MKKGSQVRKDKALTAERRFLDPKSYIGQRVHPGTDHPCQYLKGKDVGVVRLLIFERERGRCWNCGAYYGWDYGELRHLKGGLGLERCWCPENLGWGCPKCHRSEHVRVRWSRKQAAGRP